MMIENDEKLFLESSMNNHLSNELRINFVSDSFNYQENIEILHLEEDGIASYPDGWQSWSDRVKELFKSKDIYFDTVRNGYPHPHRFFFESQANPGAGSSVVLPMTKS